MKGRGVESSNKCEYNFLKTKKKLVCARERFFRSVIFLSPPLLLLPFFFALFRVCIIRLQKVKERERERKWFKKSIQKKQQTKKEAKKEKKFEK